MSRFGNHLVKQGLIGREQLENALQHRAVYGARLGTNLVELGALSVEQVGEALAAFHGVQLPPRKWIQNPQREAVNRVSRLLLERVRFVPLRLDGNVMRVAVMDPRDPRVLDDLRFAIGCRIQPYVLPEIWMHDWLLELFMIPRGMRALETGHDRAAAQTYDYAAVQLPVGPSVTQPAPVAPVAPPAARYAPHVPPRAVAPPRTITAPFERVTVPPPAAVGTHAHALQAEPEPKPEPAPVAVEIPALTVGSLGELAAMARPSYAGYATSDPEPTSTAAAFWRKKPALEESLQQDALVEVALAAPAPSPRRPAAVQPRIEPSRELAQLETELLQVTERARLIELGLAIGAQLASTLALFVMQKGMVQGLLLRSGVGGTPRAIDAVRVSLDSPSMFADAASATEPKRVDPRAEPFDLRTLELLGDAGAVEVALFPVVIAQRVVNVLYASNGDQPLGAIAFAALSALAQQLGAGYESVIRSRKVGR